MRRALVAAMAREGIPIEQAARVLLAVMGADNHIDVGQFLPEVRGGYIVQAEQLSEVLEELKPLHQAHWNETEKYRAGLVMRPDYDAMLERERLGRLLQVTARTTDGRLAGHVRMFIQTSMHTQTPYADEDTLYLAPAHRPGAGVAIRMMRYAEKCLLTLGVREIRANSKLSNHADVLMRRLGYPAVATQFCKVFGVQEAAPSQEDAAHEPPS